MKVKIIIQTWENVPNDSNEPFKTKFRRRQSEVWSGELEILQENEYLAKLSIIAEDEPQPIVDIPFATGIGYYMWIPPQYDVAEEDEGWNLSDYYDDQDLPGDTIPPKVQSAIEARKAMPMARNSRWTPMRWIRRIIHG
jgi:hypothetical protein